MILSVGTVCNLLAIAHLHIVRPGIMIPIGHKWHIVRSRHIIPDYAIRNIFPGNVLYTGQTQLEGVQTRKNPARYFFSVSCRVNTILGTDLVRGESSYNKNPDKGICNTVTIKLSDYLEGVVLPRGSNHQL